MQKHLPRIEEKYCFYRKLSAEYKEKADVAVRSSATAEGLPTASFAGMHETYLNIGEKIYYLPLKSFASCFYLGRFLSRKGF